LPSAEWYFYHFVEVVGAPRRTDDLNRKMRSTVLPQAKEQLIAHYAISQNTASA